MKKNYNFLISVLSITVFSFIVIFILSLFDGLTEINQCILQYSLFPLFVISFFVIAWFEMGKSRISKSLFTRKNLLLLSLSFLLVFSINLQVGIWATAFFAISAFFYLLHTKKWYSLNRVYYIVFIYALLRVFGTIGTSKGFYFPDKMLSFFILPLSFSCFRLKKEIALRLLRLFFRVIFVFLIFSIIFFWFNKLYYQVNIIAWMTSKLLIADLHAYHWVAGWAYYEHPTYVALVIITALISGFYLYYKKQQTAYLTKLELIFFSVFSIFTIVLLESRAGFVGCVFVFVSTALYYLYLHRKYFKIAFVACVIIGGLGLFILDAPISGFLSDNARKTEYTLAINYIKGHLWWGSGYNQQKYALKEQAELMKDELPIQTYEKTYAHNQFLGDMVQFGIPGLVILLLLLYFLFRYSIKSRSYLLQIFLGVIFIYMMIEEPLTVQPGITRFLVFVTFFVHISECDNAIKSYSLPFRKRL